MNEDRQNPPRSWLDRFTNLFSDDPQSREDIKDIVQEAAKRSVVDADTLNIIEGALKVSETQVGDIMVPRSKMVTVNINESIQEYLPRVIEAAHSRIPVMGGDSNNEIQGLLLVKDLLPLILTGNSEQIRLSDVLRPTSFVPESKRLNLLLHEFRAKQNHMAIVVDEFGGIAGLVTIEDVLEQIVGDIKDEFDPAEDLNARIRTLDDGRSLVPALTPVEDFNEHFNTEFEDDEFNTIGGIVMHFFGRMPECNESICIDGWHFKIVNSTSRQLGVLEVQPQPKAQ